MAESEAKEAAKVLRDVKALLRTPEQWTKGAFALAADGKALTSWCEDAVCWCLVGAVRRKGETRAVRRAAVRALATAALEKQGIEAADGPMKTLTDFNDADNTTFTDVVEVLDAAIAAVEKDDV